MKTIKVAEATDAQLNWLVAWLVGLVEPFSHTIEAEYWQPIVDANQMFPLVDVYAISYYIKKWDDARPTATYEVRIWNGTHTQIAFGPTALIAMARCFVMSKRGETVGIPEDIE